MLLWTTNLGFRVRESNFMKNPLLVLISLSFSGISSAVQYNGLRLAFALSLLLMLHPLMLQTVIKAALRVWRKRCISTTWSRYLLSSLSCQSQSILHEFTKLRCCLESSTMPISCWNRGWVQNWKQYQILATIPCHKSLSSKMDDTKSEFFRKEGFAIFSYDLMISRILQTGIIIWLKYNIKKWSAQNFL